MPLEWVVYDYDAGDQGNPWRIRRMVPTAWFEGVPFFLNVYGTVFTYNESGEVWIVTQQFWRGTWSGSEVTNINSVEEAMLIREFRGQGRARYMVRERDPDDPYYVLTETAVWTDYDGDAPTADWTIDMTQPDPPQFATTNETGYDLGIAQYELAGGAEYYATNPIGSTRSMTDDAATETTRIVYTAFGERVASQGTIDTRYQYAGAHGYENFTHLPWGDPISSAGQNATFNYLHVGARWYSPETGRFIQRDPIGIAGGHNVYAYVEHNPASRVDPSGRYWVWVARGGRAAGKYVWRGAKWGFNKGRQAWRWAQRKIKPHFRVERHQIPGFRNHGRLWHCNIGARHIILDPRFYWKERRILWHITKSMLKKWLF